jgi:hypothetical protein
MDRAVIFVRQVGDGHKRGRFARTVAADQGDDFAFLNI